VSQPAQYLLVGAERQRFYILWLSLSGLMEVLGNYLLIPHLGALGAAYAKGISEVFGSIGFMIYLIAVFRASLPLARMARLLVACAVMFAVVRLIVGHLPALLALLVGIPVGAAVFALLVRVLRCLDGADGDRLRQLRKLVPGRARGSYLRVVDFLVSV
jgi:O-antigen/teichoic acid export membrane protein